MSWWVTRDWEEYFTVVQWDQRGAGKTNLLNKPSDVAPTLTLERMIDDAEEMAILARRELDQGKLFVLGHSAGAMSASKWPSAIPTGYTRISALPRSLTFLKANGEVGPLQWTNPDVPRMKKR